MTTAIFSVLILLYPILSAQHYHHSISAEVPYSVTVQACSYDRLPHLVDGMQLFAKHPQLCISLMTTKSLTNLEHDLQHSTQLTARVTIAWSLADGDGTQCRLKFKVRYD
jgi:hypothetical protein